MNRKGFTLVELVAVISILGLLMIIMTPAYNNINNNIKEKNYESKKATIKKAILSYTERYLKDQIYPGDKTKCYFFSVEYLIHSGIYASDDEQEEYITNTLTNQKYSGNELIAVVYYDNDKYKLVSNIKGEDLKDGIVCDNTNSICDNEGACDINGFKEA